MLTIVFAKTKSKYYNEAVAQAKSVGGVEYDDCVVIKLEDYQLMYAYEQLTTLMLIVQKWKSLRATYNGSKVNLYQFIFSVWYSVRSCAEIKTRTCDPRHCWVDPDNEGWSCRLLNPFRREITGSPDYKKSNMYWYNFGNRDGSVWSVNKTTILATLTKSAKDSSIILCPYFDQDMVEKIVGSLPDFINLDGVNFVPYYSYNRAVNIRHTLYFLNRRIHIISDALLDEICALNFISYRKFNRQFYGYCKN